MRKKKQKEPHRYYFFILVGLAVLSLLCLAIYLIFFGTFLFTDNSTTSSVTIKKSNNLELNYDPLITTVPKESQNSNK
ncbi:MAG: hypothetical protein WC752_02020 [Patescibacteria group bacterium]|jgi:hypothetical protein